MWKILYNFCIWCYFRIGITFAALFSRKAADFVVGRRGLLGRLRQEMQPLEGFRIVWFHVSSVGEFEQARPLIEKLKHERPDVKVVLTFFSPSGYNMRRDYPLADVVSYLPMDLFRNVRRFLNIVHPDVAVFVKYEFWYNYLTSLRRIGVSTYLVSAIFRPHQWFFRWHGMYMRRMLRCFDTLFVQNKESVGLLRSVGIGNVVMAGDTRFDRVYALRLANVGANEVLEGFAGGKKLWIAGSTWGEDEELIAAVMPVLMKNEAKLVIVPHEVHASRIAAVEGLFRDYKTIRYTECAGGVKASEAVGVDATGLESAQVMVVDCIGLLSKIYKYASFAYIGGGFNRSGIHNILEPATYGCPVVFGPNYSKFQEAKDLIAAGGAFSINDAGSLRNIVSRLLGDSECLAEKSAVASSFVSSNLGATEIVFSGIFEGI